MITRKIASALSDLRRGDWTGVLAATIKHLHLPAQWFNVGEAVFLTHSPHAPPTDQPVEQRQESNPPHKSTPNLVLTCVADASVIASLVECLGEDADYYSWIQPEDRAQKFRAMLDNDSVAWIAKDQKTGKAAGFFWETHNNYHFKRGDAEVIFKLPAHSAFIECIYIQPAYRRFGIYSHLLNRLLATKPTMEFSCFVTADNTPSIKAQIKNGFTLSGRVVYYVFFGQIFVSLTFHAIHKRFFRVLKGKPYVIEIA